LMTPANSSVREAVDTWHDVQQTIHSPGESHASEEWNCTNESGG
jgi:hypothetical protein